MNGEGEEGEGCVWCVSVCPSIYSCLLTNDYKIVRGLASLLKELPASDLNVAVTAHTLCMYNAA